MRFVKRLTLLALLMCLTASCACAMGLSVTQPAAWQMRVAWSSRLDVATVTLYAGTHQEAYKSVQAGKRPYVTFDTVAPLCSWRIKAYDAQGNLLAEAGEVTGDVDKWKKFGAASGACEIVRRTNADQTRNVWEVSHPKVNTITAQQLDEYINGGICFYLHWKVQFKQKSTAQKLDTALVMLTPSGAVYVDSYKTELEKDLKAGSHWNCYPAISGNAGDVLNQYRKEHDVWEKGKYTFFIYAEGQLVRDCTLTVK